MPNQPNLTRSKLTLDAKSFQDLLSAAFTIQEHNDHLNQAQPSPPEPEASPAPAVAGVCPECGAAKPTQESPCENCGPDHLRPGERLQRNWASMWLLSQEQGLWPERSADASETVRTAVSPLASGSLAFPAAEEVAEEPYARQTTGTMHDRINAKSALSKSIVGKSALDQPTLSRPALGKAAGQNNRITEANEDLTNEDLAIAVSDPAAQTFQLSGSGDALVVEAAGLETPDATTDEATSSLLRRLADLRVVLRFHRADVYLGAAVFVAVFALMWPAATSPRRPALGTWDRALIALGIAEPPVPVVHLQGDPSIEVWIDPHSALYYCPGEEQYGKAAGGRLTSQREAQMDRFEPASRSACE
jgi:ribosomal protein L40E